MKRFPVLAPVRRISAIEDPTWPTRIRCFSSKLFSRCYHKQLLPRAFHDLLVKSDIGRLPLVRTGRPDQSICKEKSTFNQNCPARSFYFYIVCIAVMSFERKLSKEAYFIFKMTAPTGQFGLLVSAHSYDTRVVIDLIPVVLILNSSQFFI